jgi:uncharacterized protein (DUF58 family)
LSRFHRFIYPGHVRITGPSYKRTRRATETGGFVLTGIVITAALGIDTDLTLSYQLFAYLLGLYVLSGISSRFNKPNVTLRRVLPAFVTAGEPFTYQVRVRNEGERIERDLVVTEQPRVIKPLLEEYLQTPEPGEERRNAYDRFIGFHRFLWLQRRKTGLHVEPEKVHAIPVGGESIVQMKANPLRRGVVNLIQLVVSQPDPFGLVHGLTRFQQQGKLIVLPKRYRISPSYMPPGGRHYQPGGMNETRSVGESDEFVALRDYREGDRVRRIHWPSSAKRNKPVVKEYRDEYFVRQALVLDNCVDDWELLEEAVSVAASFAVALERSDSLLDLMFLADRVHTFTSGRGLAHSQQLLEVLASIERSEIGFDSLRQSVVRHAHLLSGCVLVLMSWNDERQALVSQLSHLNIPVEVLVLSRSDLPREKGIHFLKLGDVEAGLAALQDNGVTRS